MIRKNILKSAIVITVIATLLVSAGCGKKTNITAIPTTDVVVEEQTISSMESKEDESTVSFDYTD